MINPNNTDQIRLFTPQAWSGYELIDSGKYSKLERFGKYITIRPEPQAVWDPQLSASEWARAAHFTFVSKSSSHGVWNMKMGPPVDWTLDYRLSATANIQMKLSLTGFKHVGIFPEQAANWKFIYDQIAQSPHQEFRFLNLFAYTGGASLAARAAGAETYHLDSIRQVVGWARDNMELSGLDNIRWIVEDAMKFVQREVKRGKTYHGIILDPPAYGHGPDGEKWKLEDQLNELLSLVGRLLEPRQSFMVLNAYSMGFSSLIMHNLVSRHMHYDQIESGELYLSDRSGLKLPLGSLVRVINQ